MDGVHCNGDETLWLGKRDPKGCWRWMLEALLSPESGPIKVDTLNIVVQSDYYHFTIRSSRVKVLLANSSNFLSASSIIINWSLTG